MITVRSAEGNGVSASIFNLLDHPQFNEGRDWHRRAVRGNEVVFPEGDTSRDVYLILSGRVRILGNVDLDDQRRIHPGFSELGPREMFGELPIFDGQPRSASVMALEDTVLAVLDGERLMAFLDQHPDLGYPIFKELILTLVARLRKANQRIFSLFAWGLKSHGLDEHL